MIRNRKARHFYTLGGANGAYFAGLRAQLPREWRQCEEPECKHRRFGGSPCPLCGSGAWVAVEPEAEQ